MFLRGMEVYMKGFLLFLFSICLSIVGVFLMFAAFFGLGTNGIGGTTYNPALYWVLGFIGFVMFLGGIYMLRNRRRY